MREEITKLKYSKIFIILSLITLFAGCREEADRQARMDLTLCLPARDIYSEAGTRRVIGDPGQAEQFALPRYAHIFVIKQTPGGGWTMWRYREMELEEDNWEKMRYGGTWETRADSIYRYKGGINFMLNNDAPFGRVYAVCSNKKLNFNKTTGSISTMEDLMELKFDTSPDSIQENLQNIYSTPYNYEPNSRYYCSFDCTSGNSFTVDLLMYHVAAKVDLKWNVDETKRINHSNPSQAVRLTYLEARQLFNGNAYCFKPMANTLPASPAPGYVRSNIVTPSDEGLWWEGRTYFYTIPFTVSGESGYFPIHLLMRTNGSEGSGYDLTLKQRIDATSPFVPWLRGTLTLTQPLADGTDVKTTD